MKPGFIGDSFKLSTRNEKGISRIGEEAYENECPRFWLASAIAFGLVALLYALRRAPEGYENGDGFHRR